MPKKPTTVARTTDLDDEHGEHWRALKKLNSWPTGVASDLAEHAAKTVQTINAMLSGQHPRTTTEPGSGHCEKDGPGRRENNAPRLFFYLAMRHGRGPRIEDADQTNRLWEELTAAAYSASRMYALPTEGEQRWNTQAFDRGTELEKLKKLIRDATKCTGRRALSRKCKEVCDWILAFSPEHSKQ